MRNPLSLFNRLFHPRRHKRSATLRAIYIAGSAGEAMQSLNHVEAVAQTGLQGDRYSTGQGFWKVTEACQVTLISADELEKAARGHSDELQDKLDTGHHRRNLVVTGIHSRELQGKTFAIGEAQFRYLKPRPPCGYLDKVEGKGMGRALGKHSGICLNVVRSGVITVGDHLQVIEE